MRLYVCGPVTGRPGLNRPAFEEARRALEAAGYEAIVPHDFVAPDAEHPAAMRLCIATLCNGDIDGVALLGGWRSSRGALCEVEVARAVGIEALSCRTWAGRAKGPSDG